MLVARAGLNARPPVEAPRPLRPLLGFRSLTKRAAATIAKLLDEDAEFRARVAEAAADEEALGRPAWLFLHRPDGWEDEVNQAQAAASGSSAATTEKGTTDKGLERRAAKAEAEASRLSEKLARADEKAARSAERLAADTKALRLAQTELGRARAKLAGAEREREDARREAEALSAQLKEIKEVGKDEAEVVAPDPWLGLDRSDLAESIEAAAHSTQALAEQLARLEAEVRPPAQKRSGPKTSKANPPRRQPKPLPPLTYDDDLAAGDHLLAADTLLLVDGYNITISSWPDLPIVEQRRRLVDALCEMAARTQAPVHVIFDGAEDAPSRMRTTRPVKVSFTSVDVEADDRILEILDELPLTQSVVVASDDKRVRSGAAGRGANLLTREQLLHCMRREV